MGKSISMEPLRYMFIECLWTSDAKATFNHAALDIGISTVANFNKVLAEMNIRAFREQKINWRTHLVKPKSVKPTSFISRFQELNTYLAEYPSDTPEPLPVDEIMDIIYHSMPITCKNKMIEQGFNSADSTVKEMTDFFEIRVENLEPLTPVS